MSVVSQSANRLERISKAPALEVGDHLSRDEFERRYEAMPETKKAELIEGVIYMPSPVRWVRQARPHSFLGGWLFHYETATPGVQSGQNGSIRLDLDNEPQPDSALIIDPALGGQARISTDDYIVGSPELAAEVSASSASFDLNAKLRVYRRHNVREYIVWRVNDAAVDWYIIRGDDYHPLAPRADGTLESETFPGLRLDPVALTHLNGRALLQVLQEGIASAAHAEFVARLQAK